jgi:hypothetical protein
MPRRRWSGEPREKEERLEEEERGDPFDLYRMAEIVA